MTVVPSPAPADRCTVWWAAPVAPDGAPALVGLLDAHERERLGRLRRAADRARYVAAHALARLVLAGGGSGAAAAALVFDRTCRCGAPHGRPVLAGGPAFSLTHAGALVGVAVRAGGPVGLDVEQVRTLTDLDALIAHVLSPTERSRTAPLDPLGFFRTWTRKEALLKATGEGLARPMATITLGPGGTVENGLPGVRWGRAWLRDLTPLPDHPGAVAGCGPAPEVVEADGDAVLHGS